MVLEVVMGGRRGVEGDDSWVGEAYHFDDLLTNNLFNHACCFGGGFCYFARNVHHLFDIEVSIGLPIVVLLFGCEDSL